MGIQSSDLVENVVGKEEIARYEQFLLFPQCFQKLFVVMRQNQYIWSKWLKKVKDFKVSQTTDRFHGAQPYGLIMAFPLHKETTKVVDRVWINTDGSLFCMTINGL